MNFYKLTFSLVNNDYKTNSNRLEKKIRLMSVGDSVALCIYHFNVYRPKMVRHILKILHLLQYFSIKSDHFGTLSI